MPRKTKFISGIYNYCDRWCERCAHTADCRLYYDEQRSRQRHKRKGEDPDDMENVLQEVSRSFKKVARLLARDAKKHGLDLDEIKREAANIDPHPHERRIDEHPLCREAKRYMDGCGELLEALSPVFNDARDDTVERAGFMDVETEAGQLAKVRQAYDVLTWDFRLIYVKIRRALDGLFDAEGEEDEWRDASLNDAAGSASVAHKCLVRDKVALLAIYEWDEQFQDTAIELLGRAERIQRALEAQIPECTTFGWPPEQ